MEVQATIFQKIAGDVASPVESWKTGIRPDGTAIAAPMTPYWRDGDGRPFPWREGLGIEVEIAFVLNRDLTPPAGKPFTKADIIEAVSHVHLGVEIVASRIAEGNAAPFPLFLSDSLANSGYILGPELKTSVDALGEQWHVSVKTADEVLFDADAKHPTSDPLAPLLAYANTASGPLGGLKAGQLVTTGSLCGVVAIGQPGRVDITLDGAFFMTINFEAKA
jgi:2-keto-4-pentenoate hydratase